MQFSISKILKPFQVLIVISIISVNVICCSNVKSDSPPEGWNAGRLEPYVGESRIEQNLISQINSYNEALLDGNLENAKKYLYKDAIVYINRLNPDLSENEITNELFRVMFDEYQTIRKPYIESGVDFDIIVKGIKKTFDANNVIFIVFESSLTLSKGEKSMWANPDLILGITSDNGSNWTFLAIDDNTPAILRINFLDDIVNQVIN